MEGIIESSASVCGRLLQMDIQDIIQAIQDKQIRITDHAFEEAEDDRSMKPFQQCPVCDGELVEKEVQKLLRGGNDTAVMKVAADVCLQCGERLYSEDTVRRFEDIKTKLQQGQTQEFVPLGQSFQVS